MKIIVKVKPSSRRNEVKMIEEGEYEVATTATPEKGKANQAVIDLLAEHFGIARSRIGILAGHTSRSKIIEIK